MCIRCDLMCDQRVQENGNILLSRQFWGKLISTFSWVVRDQCVYETLTLTFQPLQREEMPGDHNGVWISMVPAVHAFPATQQKHNHMSLYTTQQKYTSHLINILKKLALCEISVKVTFCLNGFTVLQIIDFDR